MSYLLCTFIHENLKLKWFFGARRQANTNKLKTVSYSKSPANVHSAKMVAPERVMPPSRTSWVRFRRPRRQEQPRAQTKNRRNQRPSGVMRAMDTIMGVKRSDVSTRSMVRLVGDRVDLDLDVDHQAAFLRRAGRRLGRLPCRRLNRPACYSRSGQLPSWL